MSLKYRNIALQVNLQSLFFVVLFRKQTRDTVLDWIEAALPRRLPFLPLDSSPARALHLFITRKIEGFQEGVATRAAAQAADSRCVAVRAKAFAAISVYRAP